MRSRGALIAVLFAVALSAQVGMQNAAAGDAIVASAKWETPGADIDLVILGPNNVSYKAQQDFQSGPATEAVLIPNPGPGDYKVGVIWQNDKPNMQVPVTVEVKQGDKVVGTFQAVLSAGNPNDRKIVTTLNVGGAAAAGGADALGFAGRWVEYWPGVRDHDWSLVTFQNGQYQVAVSNPKAGPYKVDNIRIEGNVLKFTEYPGNNVIQYEVTPQDANTCMVKVQGGPEVNGQILWKREGGAGGGAAGGDMVITAKWETADADVDLRVVGPDGETYKPLEDVRTGPGAEVCVIKNARPGDYKAGVVWQNDKAGIQVPVTVEVKVGGAVVGSFKADLDKDNDRRIFSGIKGPAATGPALADLVATAKWETAGADVDLMVLGPDGEEFKPAQDVQSGPGAEVATIKNPRPGEYKARVIWMNDKAGVQVPVTVEVKQGDKVVGSFQVSLDHDNDRRVFSGIKVGN